MMPIKHLVLQSLFNKWPRCLGEVPLHHHGSYTLWVLVPARHSFTGPAPATILVSQMRKEAHGDSNWPPHSESHTLTSHCFEFLRKGNNTSSQLLKNQKC